MKELSYPSTLYGDEDICNTQQSFIIDDNILFRDVFLNASMFAVLCFLERCLPVYCPLLPISRAHDLTLKCNLLDNETLISLLPITCFRKHAFLAMVYLTLNEDKKYCDLDFLCFGNATTLLTIVSLHRPTFFVSLWFRFGCSLKIFELKIGNIMKTMTRSLCAVKNAWNRLNNVFLFRYVFLNLTIFTWFSKRCFSVGVCY